MANGEVIEIKSFKVVTEKDVQNVMDIILGKYIEYVLYGKQKLIVITEVRKET